MTTKAARAQVTPVRQRTQYTCMSTSMLMCLQACGHDLTEDEVNKVMGARPMKGAAWEQALACAQHFGCRATLTMPATILQLKQWTDQGKAVMIAWNPEGRDWSHASTVYNVTDGLPLEMDPAHQVIGSGPGMYVWVADPNIPNPAKTTRIVHEDDFYGAWYEKWPDYLVRRPACCIEREITADGRQVVASAKEYTAEVAKVSGSNVHLKGQGHPLLKRGLIVPSKWLPVGRPQVGDEFIAIFNPRDRDQPWSFTVMDFNMFASKRAKTASRSPNQTGSAVLLKRQGLIPVDVFFGDARPHRRAIVMPGESVEDQSGKLWLFVGTDEDGKAILAKDKRDLKRMQGELERARNHHRTASQNPKVAHMALATRVAAVYLFAEAHDCYKDYKGGGLSYAEYQECLKRFEDEESGYRRRAPRRAPSSANKPQLEALDGLLAKRPGDRFIKSLRDQVAQGRKLSDKQLKAVRQNLYKNRMKDKADLFRAAGSHISVADRYLAGDTDV
jgi:hypothetical protein